MQINGPLRLKVNGKFFITGTNFSSTESTPTKPHVGGYGPFGMSQGWPTYTGSVKVSIPAGGVEFKFRKELGGADGGVVEVLEQYSNNVLAKYEGVYLSQKSLAVDEVQGSSDFTIGFAALVDAMGNT